MNRGSGFFTTLVVGSCLMTALSGCCGRRGLSLKGGWNLEVRPALVDACQVPVSQECAECTTGSVDGSGCAVASPEVDTCGDAGCGTCGTCLRPGRALLRQIGQAVTGERYFDRPHFHPVPTQPAFTARQDLPLDVAGQTPLEPVPAAPNPPMPKSGSDVLVPEPEVVPAPLPVPATSAPMPSGSTGWRPRDAASCGARGSGASWVFKPPVQVGLESGAQAHCSGGCNHERMTR